MKRFMLAALLSLALAPAPGAAQLPDPDTLGRLERGDVVAREARTDEKGGSARMLILAEAPARALWEVVVSCEKAFVFVEGLRACEVLEDHGDRVLVHQVVKQSWLIPTQDFVFESIREPYRRIGFHLVEGNLRSMQGEWRFAETEHGTIVDYEIGVEPAMPVPAFLLRRSVRKDMPDLLACIRALAGGSLLGPAGRASDLGRCSGPTRPQQALNSASDRTPSRSMRRSPATFRVSPPEVPAAR